MSPTPVSMAVADRPGRLRLGGDDRTGRRPLRRAGRADRPVRPQHRADATRDRPGGARDRRASRAACPSTRRPTTAGSWPRPRPATASGPTRSSSAPAPTRSSTSSPRRSCRRAGRRSSRPRRTRCTGSSPSSAARGRRRAAPRRRTSGFAIDAPAVRAAAREAAVVWLCSPNNPTAPGRARRGRSPALLDGLAADAAAAGARRAGRRPRRGLRRVRRDEPRRPARAVSAPHRRPDREQGLRARRPPGRASRSAAASVIAAHGAVPAAGLGLDRVGGHRHRRPSSPTAGSPRGRAPSTPSASAWPPPSRPRAGRRYPRVTNFLLVPFGIPAARPRRSPRRSSGAASSRARSAPAIRSPTTSG